MVYKKKLMIDLDGVLNNYTYFDENNIPEIKNGAKEFLQKLYDTDEYELVLFTTRNRIMAFRWLVENNLDRFFKDITNIKEPAYLYVDDRAVQFNGNFEQTIDYIEKFKVYWK